MAPKYKLTYFNLRGRAELLRYIFAAAGQDYEDYRLKDGEFATLKPKTPFGQLPIMEIDGEVVFQTNSMARYLAGQLGLAGANPKESLKADIVVDTVEDIAAKPMGFFREPDAAKKAELKKKFVEELLPVQLENLQKILVANNGGTGFFVGDKLSWADLKVYAFYELMASAQVDIPWDKVPKLKEHQDRVGKLPKIAEWIAKRPKSDL